MEGIFESNIADLKLMYRGKVRDLYDLGRHLLLVATDRISAFDFVLPTPIPDKGKILTAISLFWFRKLAHVMPNHLVDLPIDEITSDARARIELEGRATVGLKTEPLKVEAIVRGFLSGSGWADYRKTGSLCGMRLPEGLIESARLPEPLFTPSTKAPRGAHDENISFDQMKELVGTDLAEKIKEKSLALYSEASTWAESRGLIIADTKFEFGLREGELILIDEVLTPDSSRFWDMELYEPGRPQPSFDKQLLRDYLTGSGWDRNPPAPQIPEEIVEQTRDRYRTALHRLTG